MCPPQCVRTADQHGRQLDCDSGKTSSLDRKFRWEYIQIVRLFLEFDTLDGQDRQMWWDSASLSKHLRTIGTLLSDKNRFPHLSEVYVDIKPNNCTGDDMKDISKYMVQALSVVPPELLKLRALLRKGLSGWFIRCFCADTWQQQILQSTSSIGDESKPMKPEKPHRIVMPHPVHACIIYQAGRDTTQSGCWMLWEIGEASESKSLARVKGSSCM